MSTTAEALPENTSLPLSSEAEDTAKGVAKATGVIALGNISSRILGLVREIILSNLFGASAAVDAFKIAVIVPRGLYDLLIGGHVNSALIPVLSDYAARDNRRDLWQLVNLLLGLVTVLLIGLVILIELLAPWIVEIVSNEKTPLSTRTQAIELLRITAPALFFLSLFAVISGLLYALKRFTLPAFGASVFNGTIVVLTILFASQIGITAAALGWLLGSLIQLAVQLPALRDAKIRPTLKNAFSHPGVRTIGLLYIPVLFSLGLDVLINRPFSYNLASGTGEGNIGIMEWATTLIQFPHGLVATAISVAVLPTLAQQALKSSTEGLTAFKDTLGLGLRLATVLILPATIGLFVLATPVIALLFEHGAFTHENTKVTAIVLRLYLIGMPFAALDLILIFAFYARQDTMTPALIGLFSLIAYMLTAILLLPLVGFYSLMIADSVKHVVHSSASGWLLWRRLGGLRGQNLLNIGLRATAASLIMGAAVLISYLALKSIIDSQNILIESLYVILPGGLGGLVFTIVGQWLNLTELQWLISLVQQRLRRPAS